jgi:hypothetical protein
MAKKISDKERLDWLARMRLWVHWDNVHFERKKGRSLRQAIDAVIRAARSRKGKEIK